MMEIIERKLNDIGVYINGKAFKPDEWQKEGTPIIRIENLSNPLTEFNYYKGKCDKKYLIKNGDILLSWSATLDAYIWDKEDAFLNQHIFKVLPKIEVLDHNFSFYLMKYAILTLRSKSHGSTMVHVTRPIFDNLRVKFPKNKSDQQRIASEIKEKLTTVEKMRHAALKQKEAVAALHGALLREVFPYKEGDKLPEGWKWEKIEDLLTCVQYGISDELNTEGVGFKIFRMNEIENFRMKDNGSMKFVNVSKKIFSVYKLNSGDILFNRTNSFELVGKSGLFDIEGDYCFASYLIRLTPDTQKINPLFLAILINSPIIQEALKGIATKAVSQANINAQNLRKIKLAIPVSIESQKGIAEYLDGKIASFINLNKKAKTQLEAIKALAAAIMREVFEFNS